MNSPLRLRFYGRLREVAGASSRDVTPSLGVRTTDDLIEWIASTDEDLGAALRHPSVKAAIGDRIVPRGDPIGDAAEVSFLPPFSGG